MNRHEIIETITQGQMSLGIELGSTRIKSVLIDRQHRVLANGSFQWENRLENSLWTYHLEDAVYGLQQSFLDLAEDVKRQYGIELTNVGSIGISGMMHGFLILDAKGNQLAPFLTWRNTNTTAAADVLTKLWNFNIPLRWSIAHLYQAILDDAEYVREISYMTTLAGYIHYLLSGERVMGIGEASGMFPIDSENADYDQGMIDSFNTLVEDREYPWQIKDILPKVLTAGQKAGVLTDAGAAMLDPRGILKAGIPMAPPEGDAGTGMVATNSIELHTGNVSAGTSIFSMVVLEKPLRKLYKDIDMVTTPSGRPVAMVHCNNGTSELDAWMRMFSEVALLMGADESKISELYTEMFTESLNGDPDCDGILLYNYISGEPVTGVTDGRPLLVRRRDSKLSLANFMRSQIYATLASLAVGMQILADEKVVIKRLTGHGGLFKTPGVAERYLSAALKSSVTVMKTAGEGGPYGMAILAAYLLESKEMTLEQYLRDKVFDGVEGTSVEATADEIDGFARYLKTYQKGLALEECVLSCVD